MIEDSEHPYKNKLKMNDFENFMVDVNMNDMDIKFIEEEKIVGYIAYKINKNQLCVYQLYSSKKQTELVLLQDIMKEGESKGTSVMSIDVVIGDNTKKEVVEKLGFQCTGYNQSIESNERTKELGNR